jgi:phosphohistidine phosphatase
MKTLVLLRHAKSAHPGAGSDFERTLSQRGWRDAPAAGLELKRRKLRPDIVVSSPAVRARETAETALSAAGLPDAPVFEPDVYEASSDRLLRVIRGLPAAASSALLVGHNPGMEELLARLAPEDATSMPTAALVCLHLDVSDWDAASNGCGRVAWRWAPKDRFG